MTLRKLRLPANPLTSCPSRGCGCRKIWPKSSEKRLIGYARVSTYWQTFDARLDQALRIHLARREPFSNRSSPVKIPVYVTRPGHGSLRGQRGLPQHLVRSGGQALQGPQRAYVDTRPPARRAIACTLALGRCVLEYLTRLMRYAAMTGSAQRNGSPDRQTLCRMTDSLRAKATRALPEPERRSIVSAQFFKCSGRFTR